MDYSGCIILTEQRAFRPHFSDYSRNKNVFENNAAIFEN